MKSRKQTFHQLWSLTSKKWKKVKVAQSCMTLCDPMDCSQPGSPVRKILQARILEWVVIPFSRGSSQSRDQTWLSYIADRFFTAWITTEFHIYAIINTICFFLSDLLHSVWWTLGPSTSLQMTHFHPFYDWVIFCCAYVPHFLYPLISWWRFRLLPCPGYCK